ncbi:MAG: hypothetical protein ACRD15_10475 [Vicinamibacterales bacterium]
MIEPRSVAALASFVLLCAAAGCTNFYEIPIETPIQPKMDVTPFTRVLVAGFIGGGTDDVDANLETVRLLRSQLRSKSTLRVIEAEALPLADIARDQAGRPAGGPALPAGASTNSQGAGGGPGAADPMVSGPQTQSPAPVPQLPAESAPQTQSPPPVPSLPALPAEQQPTVGPPVAGLEDDGKIRNEKDLERFQAFFNNADFWKKLGEEHQNPLIVTGTVLFTNTQSNGFVNTNREVIDPLGRRVVQPYRVYMERKGFIIEPRFIFIDGRTGAVLYSDRFHEEILYSAQQNVPALSSYFELMDRLIPSFLGSLSTQRIRGTRVLLK